jgi:hypothetical protein
MDCRYLLNYLLYPADLAALQAHLDAMRMERRVGQYRGHLAACALSCGLVLLEHDVYGQARPDVTTIFSIFCQWMKDIAAQRNMFRLKYLHRLPLPKAWAQPAHATPMNAATPSKPADGIAIGVGTAVVAGVATGVGLASAGTAVGVGLAVVTGNAVGLAWAVTGGGEGDGHGTGVGIAASCGDTI